MLLTDLTCHCAMRSVCCLLRGYEARRFGASETEWSRCYRQVAKNAMLGVA